MEAKHAVLGKRARTIEFRTRSLQPEGDEVLVRILACGICRGDLIEFTRERAEPAAFGHEPVGQVVACGPCVTRLAEGDWVVGSVDGAFATYALGRESDLLPIPPDLGETAALAEPLKCVATAVRAAAPDFGDAVVVVGCGFMGLAAVAALKGGWAPLVIAVEPDSVRRRLAIELGATHALDPRSQDVVTAVRDLAGGRGADVALDFAGTQAATTLAARLLRTRGRLVAAAGFLPQDQGMEIYLRAITLRCTPPAYSPDPKDDWRRALEAIRSGRFPVDRLLTHRFPLSKIQEAFDTALQGSQVGYLKGIVFNDFDESPGAGP